MAFARAPFTFGASVHLTCAGFSVTVAEKRCTAAPLAMSFTLVRPGSPVVAQTSICKPGRYPRGPKQALLPHIDCMHPSPPPYDNVSTPSLMEP